MGRRALVGVAVAAAALVAGVVPASADHTAGSSGTECYAGPFSGTRIPTDISTPWFHQWTLRDGRTVLFCVFAGLPSAIAWDDPENAVGIDYVAPTRPEWHGDVLCELGELEYGRGTFVNLPGGVALLACEWAAPEGWRPAWGFGNRPFSAR